MFDILASIAEFETALRRERQMEGIGSAKAKGETGGRPALVTPETKAEMVQLNAQGMSIRKIAARVGFSKATVQKAIAGREKAAAEDVLCQKLEYR
ncbi:helix-turn-helix domain-containing protein [Mesorhizobium sp.]|uniref:helix-turn-helix domain-containing protein n=1 Tax=Mesorhizobium sp. TaxID=1871066 RepID=UPI000FE7CBDD|nr:helix-turn-helix domain-containing protein [Mesorhizobium sp.]RWP66270.1 MAG: recombinase family protein [Mesorhizobium sp.]